MTTIAVLLWLTACAAKKEVAMENEKTEDLEVVDSNITGDKMNGVREAFKDKSYMTLPNKDKTHLLCISKSKDRNLPNQTRFLVCDMEGNIVYKLRTINGKVLWLDNESIEVRNYYGHIQIDKDGNEKTYNSEIIQVVLPEQ